MCAFAAALAMGCSALLGVDDIAYADPDATPNDADGARDASDAATTDATSPDGAEPDASPARDACAPNAPGSPSDPRNCGACGHDCRGGGCTSGVCQPYKLADDPQVVGIAVDDTTVWWTRSTGEVSRSIKTQWLDASVAFSQGATADPEGIATTEAGAAWAENSFGSAIGALVLGGRVGGTKRYGSATPTWVRASGSAVYWISFLSTAGSPPGIRWLEADAAASSITTQGTLALDLAMDDGSYYWAAVDGVWASPRGVGAGRTLVTDSAVAVAVRGTHLYWVTKGQPSTLATCELPACPSPPTVLTSLDAFKPSDVRIAVDDAHVYLALHGQQPAVVSCAVAGCATPTVVKAGQPDLRDIAVDDGAVYWTSYDNAGGAGSPDRGVWAVVK
jgi:hypothetical protein